jgi:hypothetical protein
LEGKTIKYLGVVIEKKLDKVFEIHYNQINANVQEDFRR